MSGGDRTYITMHFGTRAVRAWQHFVGTCTDYLGTGEVAQGAEEERHGDERLDAILD